MKHILSLIIGGALVVSGFGQTRNVLVNTNNAVVQPTNFWSADASNARTGLGLGSAATNSESAFQAASSVLTNISLSNGGDLTNIQAASIVGVIPASNISSINLTNIGGSLPVASGGTGATNAADARTNLGATSVGSALFTASSASNARTALLLGSAATNNSSDFQPADLDLTNLAANNAINLTNFPTLLLRTNGNGAGLTNLTAANITGTVALASNLSSPLALTNGGTGATNASNARIALGLGTAATNNTEAFVASSSVMSNLSSSNAVNLTNLQATNIVGQIPASNISSVELSNLSGALAISSGGTGATNAETARTNLDLGALSSVTFSNLTLSNGANTNLSLALGSTNRGFYATTGPERIVIFVGGVASLQVFSNAVETGAGINLNVTGSGSFGTNLQIGGPISFSGTNASGNAATTRTNLGLGWPALTNSNAGTSLVSVDTNGEVVSPTNFWQAAPITTTFIESQPTTNFTTNITAARFLHIHSLNTNIVNVTNTIALPTNGSTYNGDIALVVHQGPTNSMTRVRSVGSTNDIATMTRYNEAIEFVYYNNVWQFNHNEAFTEPIYFAGTNAVAHAAESRTNLGLGWIALTNTQNTLYSGVVTSILGFASEITSGGTNLTGNNVLSYTNTNTLVIPANILIAGDSVPSFRSQKNVELNGAITIRTPLSSPTTIYANNSITATDDSTYTNTLVTFGSNSVAFSNVTASGTLTATGTVTATTNLVVNGFVDFSTNHTNVAPATNNQIQKFLQIRIGTNAYFLPLYQ